MKTVIVAVNSKFVHTLLAPRYLKANCIGQDVEIYETNINVPIFSAVSDVYSLQPDIVAVSTYIFNTEFIKKFLSEIKKAMPGVITVAGGWEASFDESAYLTLADYIIKGEGDFAFSSLIKDIEIGKYLPRTIECGVVENLDGIVSPYTEEYAKLGKEKILYLETTRGCPFSCGYCMSGNSRRVRCFSLERTFEDIRKITAFNPKQIKFVDRTFNFDMRRADRIFNFLIDNYNNSETNFHFEMSPELFSEEIFSTLKRAKTGLFQFEIGVQSYNPKALECVNRKAKTELIDENIRRLVGMGNIIVHVDLIAALPGEDYKSFVNGFNRLISLRPHNLQLGFLKILKGSALSKNTEGYTVSEFPPYEVLSSKDLPFSDIIKLKQAEEMLETFYNSGKFKKSVNYLLENSTDAYEFFYGLSQYVKNKYPPHFSFSAFHKCDLLFGYGTEKVFNRTEDMAKVRRLESLIEEDYEIGGNNRKWHKCHKTNVNGVL